MTYILGISSFYHDSAAALIKDGKIIGAAQEERFTRVRHDASFPHESIKYVLSEANIELSEVDKIVFYEKPFLKFERLLETYVAFFPNGFKSFAASVPVWIKKKLFQKKLIKDELKKIQNIDITDDHIKFCEHHMSHAASAFYPSPFKKSLVLTLDGVGEWATTTIGIGDGNNIKILEEIHFPHSIGLLYSAFTYYLGFKVNSGEYKVMGLAPYGKPKYKDLILEKLITLKDDGSFNMSMKYFDYATGLTMINSHFEELFGEKKRDNEKNELNQFHMNIAASIQAVIEEVVIKISIFIKKKYMLDNLCLAGGVALNCVANSKILKKKIFKSVWIQPAAGDAGGSLGCALSYWYQHLDNDRKIDLKKMQGSYLGPKYSKNQIIRDFESINAKFKVMNREELLIEVAKNLDDQKVIGWFQGRMEFGPRALGNRSILADPRSEQMQKNLNLNIKFRESFRPFAPSILKDRISEYFQNSYENPYMLLVDEIKTDIRIYNENSDVFGIEKLNQKRSVIPAVTHVDYSARVQTVDKDMNKIFYDLIKCFDDITNCPVLINTSFNIRGEPIVCSPLDAYKCFMNTNIDVLVCENVILYKKDQDIKKNHDYKKNYPLD